MKTAYRIVTPIIAVGGIAIGIFLKLFTFVVGNSNDTINNLISASHSRIEREGRRTVHLFGKMKLSGD